MPQPALAIGAALVAMIVAAKAHGRQVRLEREHAGYHIVAFGGENPPFVEALWRRDRIRFWSVAPVAALALAALLYWRDGASPLLWVAPAGGMFVGFVVAGLRSWAGLRRSTPEQRRGSVVWWSAALALGVAAGVAAAA